ncbi:MAG: amidohydrolase [Oscillospiraceae bacterium]|jgi:5-methylthioadenosine/S-adenosylhomocysteine deaminase|nr:amidohydrolase [Oscillospiraceae bacterium]
MIFRNIYYLDESFAVRRGCVAARGDTIEYVGDSVPGGDFGEVIDGAARLLLPGLINAHCHVPMTLLRGYGEGLPLDRWLNERVFPFEDRIGGEDAYWGALVGIAEMLAGGVTSFSDMYDHCDRIAEAVRISGIKANLARGIVAFGEDGLYGSSRHEESLRLLEKWHGAEGGRILVETALHSEYMTNERTVREMAEFCAARGLRAYTHLSETKKEHDECVERRGVTPARYFEDLGFFDIPVTVAHCTHVTGEDIAILEKHGVSVVHCPESNLKLGSGVAPVAQMLAGGVNVALGTDGASSNNNLNRFEEMHAAGMIHRGVARNPELTPAAQVVRMATQNGAAAQGRADTGVIKAGFKADFAVLNLGKPHLTPVHDVMSDIVFAAQAGDVEMTVVDGRIVYRDGEFLLFDAREAMEKAAKSAARIAGELE